MVVKRSSEMGSNPECKWLWPVSIGWSREHASIPATRMSQALQPAGRPLREETREPLVAVYPAAGRDFAVDGRNSAGRRGGLPAPSGCAAATGRFSDNSSHDSAARSEPRDDGFVSDAAVG